ncbi:MAG: helix-turn-helix transcriptional regulator [Erysipelotrichaceae bacterium]|nr:helix-turn-helix transcriptional regulator [Erysipelotrichaceae bacterium]
MELDNEKIARFLAELRKRNNLSQTDLADVLGVSERTVGRWEKGSALPTMNDVVNIVNYFGISLEEVFSGQLSIEREVDRKLTRVSDGINGINSRLVQTEQNISEQLDDFKNELNRTAFDRQSAGRDDLSWLYLLLIHLFSAGICFCWLVLNTPTRGIAVLTSVLYVTAVSFLVLRKRNNGFSQRMFLIYSLAALVNLLVNYALLKDSSPGIMVNALLLLVNGPAFGLSAMVPDSMEFLLVATMAVYLFWSAHCTYTLIAENRRKRDDS